MKIRSFYELSRLKTFEERFNYLKLKGVVGESTFGYDRYLNQILYRSGRWIKSRDKVIIRDNGFDLGMFGHAIHAKIIIHHMNPIDVKDIELDDDRIYDPDFLISTSMNTHNAIHFGDSNLLPKPIIERKLNDTCPWK
jgi:hypothetical protein